MKQFLTGIRIYSAMSFADSFRPIFTYMKELYFVEERGDSSFIFPWDDESVYERYKNSAIISDPKHGFVFHSKVLTSLCELVSEDWNAISLLDSREIKTHQKFEQQRYQLQQNEQVSFVANRILFFHNYDGAFWQFFTNIDGVTNAMISHHNDSPNIDLRMVDISKHYWDVGGYRDDYPERVE